MRIRLYVSLYKGCCDAKGPSVLWLAAAATTAAAAYTPPPQPPVACILSVAVRTYMAIIGRPRPHGLLGKGWSRRSGGRSWGRDPHAAVKVYYFKVRLTIKQSTLRFREKRSRTSERLLSLAQKL